MLIILFKPYNLTLNLYSNSPIPQFYWFDNEKTKKT